MDFKNVRLLMSVLKKNHKDDELQSTLNNLLDDTILEVTKHNNGVLPLPDIQETFNQESRWKPHGKIIVSNGEFSDLTTLKRIDDVHLTRDGRKFTGSCNLRLSKGCANYKKYSLKYGIKVKGALSSSVDGVSFAVKVTINWCKRKHRMNLEDLKITNVGKIKIKITGLGPLNRLTSKLISWITLKWKDSIVLSVQELLRQRIEEFFFQIDF